MSITNLYDDFQSFDFLMIPLPHTAFSRKNKNDFLSAMHRFFMEAFFMEGPCSGFFFWVGFFDGAALEPTEASRRSYGLLFLFFLLFRRRRDGH